MADNRILSHMKENSIFQFIRFYINVLQIMKHVLNYNLKFETMQTQVDRQQIQQYIKQYLRFWDLNQTLQVLQDEQKKKLNSQSRVPKSSTQTKLQLILKSPITKTKQQLSLQKQNKLVIKKYQQVLQAGRQIFAVSINLLQIIHNIKDGNQKYQSLNDTIQNHKIQLGKHHKIIINQGRVQGTQLISQGVIKDHKNKLEQHFKDKYVEGIIQILLSLRVNALQIAPELRKMLVQQLIRRDIFRITQNQNFQFILDILNIKNKSLKHAITSLISVIVSTLRGIQYITYGENDIVIQKVMKILKEQQNGNVTQRFCLAILQKCSIKDNLIQIYIQNDLINWVLGLVKKSSHTKIHMFCLDFATAMLANIIHSRSCQTYLQKKPQTVCYLMQSILKYIREPLQVSVLMHLLITLSYLCKQKFKKSMDQMSIAKRVQQFVDFYQGLCRQDGEAAEMDKRTVLDLCNHMFHSKDNKQELYDTEQRIREYQNQQGELIFECFQDQVS